MTDPLPEIRPPSRLRDAGWAFLFIILGFAATIVLGAGLGFLTGAFNHRPAPEGGESFNLLVVQTVATVLGFLFATWAVGRDRKSTRLNSSH